MLLLLLLLLRLRLRLLRLLLLLLLLLSLRILFPADSNTESDDTRTLSLDQLIKNRYWILKTRSEDEEQWNIDKRGRNTLHFSHEINKGRRSCIAWVKTTSQSCKMIESWGLKLNHNKIFIDHSFISQLPISVVSLCSFGCSNLFQHLPGLPNVTVQALGSFCNHCSEQCVAFLKVCGEFVDAGISRIAGIFTKGGCVG